MNDELNHSDSEEIVQENPDFQGNDFVFKRRDGQQLPSNKNSTNKKTTNNAKRGGATSGTRKSGSRSSGRLNIEDLEA